MFVCVGITQDRIDECRGAKETAMLADIQALLQSKADLNAQDDNGATLVRLSVVSACIQRKYENIWNMNTIIQQKLDKTELKIQKV